MFTRTQPKGNPGIFLFLLTGILLIGLGGKELWAFTYTYRNGSAYAVTVTVRFYDDTVMIRRVEPRTSQSLSTPSLLKSWKAEAFVEGSWKHVLNSTCDLLPGDYTFSLYAGEKKEGKKDEGDSWGAVVTKSGG